ncbi:MAG TPA: hypothetical protein VFL13_11005 [Candidatus Baltobacteraceae bacterium]|nr:hypothetical protein [Candidatus Baltobacteraceae bacterium]
MPSISLSFIIVIAFVTGVLLFGVGTAIMRTADGKEKTARWPVLVDDDLVETDVATRRDLIQRLAMIDSEWSRGVLETALRQEREPELRELIETTLSR